MFRQFLFASLQLRKQLQSIKEIKHDTRYKQIELTEPFASNFVDDLAMLFDEVRDDGSDFLRLGQVEVMRGVHEMILKVRALLQDLNDLIEVLFLLVVRRVLGLDKEMWHVELLC